MNTSELKAAVKAVSDRYAEETYVNPTKMEYLVMYGAVLQGYQLALDHVTLRQAERAKHDYDLRGFIWAACFTRFWQDICEGAKYSPDREVRLARLYGSNTKQYTGGNE